ncbi:MAG TPA: pitrilysin family protein, partial [Thermoanaerobaculia bacterium]|nr:pitrilysin family protein [Thermoanaerobaculia bacterium]
MKQWAALCAFVCLAAMPAVAATFDPAPYALDITTSRLANGLTVLVIRDVHVSDATVELWFRVGSGDETAEQHGLAHLFEHTLPGAKNVTTPVPNRLAQRRDSLDSNGSTAVDYTNMFQRVPATSIELPIAVFAERMSAAPESITDADLAANRDIVFAEFRNSIGRPWDAAVAGPMRRVLFGSDHPYGHAVIGTQLQLDALTTEDVRRWFRARYGAANTMLVVSGNVDPAQVVALAKKHFGSIAAGQSYPLALAPVTPRDRDESLALSVPQAKPSLTLAWRTPAWSDPSRQEVALAVELLRRRLTDALQCEVTEGYGFTGAAGGAAVLQLPCGDPSRARQLLSSFLTSTPDIAPVRDDRLADLSEQLQHLGWRSSRAQWVGEGLWLAGDAKAYLAQVERIATATPAS